MSLIATPRLVLRPLAMTDVPRIADLANDWDVTRMAARMPYPYTEEAAIDWLSSLENGEVVAGITLGQAIIGLTGFAPLPSDPASAEVGFWLGKPYWGQGYATEAVGALIRHAFRTTPVKRLECAHFLDNEASRRVIAKLGFRETGHGRARCQARRAAFDTVRYEMLRPQPLWARLPLLGRPG